MSISFELWPNLWNSAYSCFTFGEVGMVPTVEEYIALLRCLRIQVDKVYSRAANKSLRDQILAHPDIKKRSIFLL
ncbi:hypothetical protein Goshw_003234 [Gossypium schwendimanii]|uniref:Uncharacterized protein n=1 Tax=Gossypium schwendimanii TaxID=34291 RepID=A0A7J9N739_GOSSC|nr:hypothetical protein [Gossypium schwendimanii]